MKQYFTFKSFYSLVLLALVDARYHFIWASIGAPGYTHDSTYFELTNLCRRISEGDVIPKESCVLNNVNIPPIVLGDGAFPLKTWMMKPYGDAVPTPRKRYFNCRGSRGRLFAEGAFIHLKSRSSVLHRKCESNKNTFKAMSFACVVLHNIFIEKRDLIPRKLDLTFDDVTNKRKN